MAADSNPLPEVLARFDFSGGAMPAGLVPQGGQWTVKDGTLMQSAETDAVSLASVDVGGQADYRVQAQVRMLNANPGATAGLAARMQQDGSCYALVLHVRSDGRKVAQIRRWSAGEPDPCMARGITLVGDNIFLDDIDLEAWHTLALDCRGSSFVGYLDGQWILSAALPETELFEWTDFPRHHDNIRLLVWDSGSAGILAQRTGAAFGEVAVFRLSDDAPMPTWNSGLYDGRGHLRPCRLYADYVERQMEYQLNVKRNVLMVPGSGRLDPRGMYYPGDDDLEVVPHGVRDGRGRKWPSYCVYNYAHGGNTAYWNREPVECYPGDLYYYLMSGLLDYYAYSGHPECLGLARELGDWMLRTRKPDGAALAGMPHTSGVLAPSREHVFASFVDVAFGAPLLARAWVALWQATGDAKYLDAAVRVGQVLKRLQRPDGGWPGRVDWKTGELHDTKPSDWVFPALALLEDLYAATGDSGWLQMRDRGLSFVMRDFLQDLSFPHGCGHCTDFPPDSDVISALAAAEMMRYLADHVSDRPDFGEITRRVVDWMEAEQLILGDHILRGGCGIQETSSRPHPENDKIVVNLWGYGAAFTMPFVGSLARLHEATGEARYRNLAFDMFNTSTYFQYADGRQRQAMLWFSDIPFTCCPSGVSAAIDFFSVFPGHAPADANHMLRWSRRIRSINYGPDKIAYRTFADGEEMLKIGAGEPARVLVDGKEIRKAKDLKDVGEGWAYDSHSQILRLRHLGRGVEIELE